MSRARAAVPYGRLMTLDEAVAPGAAASPHREEAPRTVTDKAAVEAVLAQHPALHVLGYGPTPGNPNQPRHRLDVANAHAKATTVRQVEAARQWLSTMLEPTARVRSGAPSAYALKHRFERASGTTTSSGAFIVAVLLEPQFPIRLDYDPRVGVTERSYRDSAGH